MTDHLRQAILAMTAANERMGTFERIYASDCLKLANAHAQIAIAEQLQELNARLDAWTDGIGGHQPRLHVRTD